MAYEKRPELSAVHGLARVQREKHWTAIMDTVLAFMIVFWIAGLSFSGVVPAQAEAILPVIIGVLVVHRLLVVLERHRRDPEPGHVPSRRSDVALDVSSHLRRRTPEGTHAA
ncbi:MAG: hypothetical protein ABIN79_00695 [Marmoricola sp.]